MPFKLPTFTGFRDLVVDMWSGYLPEANLNKFGANFKRISSYILGATDNHEHIRQVGLDLMPDSAEGDFLTRHQNLWGVPKRGASGASGTIALKVTGTAASPVPVNEAMLHVPSGLGFKTTTSGVINADGFLLVDVASTDTGEETNLEAGEELEFVVTPAGLDDDAAIVTDLAGGNDIEPEGEARARLINRIGAPAAGGNRNDWENFVLESNAEIKTAYVYPGRNGQGTVDIVGLKAGQGANRILSGAENTQLSADLALLRPVSAVHRVLSVTSLEVDVEITLVPESEEEFNFDWDDSTPPTVAAYTVLTRLLQFNAARPPNMKAGDRLVLDSAGGTGREETIEALTSTDSVILKDDLSFTPIAADPVYSGGPIVAAARGEVLSLINNLGPANPDAAPYGSWEGNIRLSKLFEGVQTSEGVLDSIIVSPVANVAADDPIFPNNTSVELLIPGKIITRKQ